MGLAVLPTKTSAPPSYAGLLGEEADVLLNNIKKGLTGSVAAGDIYRGLGFYTRSLKRYADCGG